MTTELEKELDQFFLIQCVSNIIIFFFLFGSHSINIIFNANARFKEVLVFVEGRKKDNP